MAKAAVFFVLMTLFLCVSSTHEARRHPADNPSFQGFDEEKAGLSCDGVGEEECLMRRTLVAHIDYIYTQGKIHD